jgi:hypothetical protein
MPGAPWERRRRRAPRRAAVLAAVLLAAAPGTGIAGLACASEADAPSAVRPIPGWLLPPGEAFRVLWSVLVRGERVGPQLGDFQPPPDTWRAEPIPHVALPVHPFMAAGGSNMHNDAYISDAYAASGPEGRDPVVISRTQGFGGYGTLAFDRAGRIVAVYSNGRRFELELMDPRTLEELASYELPARSWSFLLQGILPWEYIVAGMYFYLDERDRAVVPTTDNRVVVVQTPPPGDASGFALVREYDLAARVRALPWPQRDSVAWVMPEWSGQREWFATTAGVVGTIDRESGAVRTRRLAGEILENSFAVGEDGVFVISDHALYRFEADPGGKIATLWRSPYDRGPGPKPGHISRGSGASVTLVGDRGGLVVVTDNAEPRVHLLFLRREDGDLVCAVPLFEEGRSGTDISVAAFEHADATGRGTGHYSAVAENNWGHHRFPRSRPEPGLVRVDARLQPDGRFVCEEVWSSPEKSIGVFKLSLGSGLVYMYGRDDSPRATGWYFVAVDARTGETVFRKHTGLGHGFNNWAGALFLHPEGGTAYSTTIFGLVQLRDGARGARARFGRERP